MALRRALRVDPNARWNLGLKHPFQTGCAGDPSHGIHAPPDTACHLHTLRSRARDRMTTTHFNTKDRILGAAEELFAQYGFAGTSLRQVTSRADVNIAAVNYHFGSKENLVNEVFRRRMDEMSEQRLNRLRLAQEQHPDELEPILAAFIEPALALTLDKHGSAFVRV